LVVSQEDKKMALDQCPCGSGNKPWVASDARGISIGYVCETCIEQKKGKYRPEIFTNSNYEADDLGEDDYYDYSDVYDY
jgi:hypothetical protein